MRIKGEHVYKTQQCTLNVQLHIVQTQCDQLLNHVGLFVTPWTAAHQAPLSMGLSRKEYWSGLPFPSPGDLPKVNA